MAAISIARIPLPPVVAEKFDEPIKTSFLGTPIYSNLVLEKPDDPDFPLEENVELDNILITVVQTKNIVKTPLNGRNGTVKEYISDGDFEIRIQGSLVNQNMGQKPKEESDNLAIYLRHRGEIKIVSAFLQIYNITSIVVDTYRISEKAGSLNEVPFLINAVSDEDIEVRLIDK